MNKKGLFIVEEFKNFKKNSGAYVHTMVSFKELSKGYEMTWYDKPSVNKFQEISNISSGKIRKSYIIKGTLKDLKVILKEVLSLKVKILYLKNNKFDFIYQRTNYLSFSWIVAARITSTPIFIEVNGIFSKDIKKYQKSLIQWFVKRIEKWMYRKANHGFYVGGINIELGINTKNCTVIQNGIWSDEIESIDKVVINEKYSNDNKTIKLVFVGHIMNHHRLDFLIDAINETVNKEKFELHIIGDENPNIKLNKKVDFPIIYYGSKHNTELVHLLENFHFGVVAYAEDYYSNMKLFTYIAKGLPVIIPRTRNFKDVFDESVPFYFDNLDINSLKVTLDRLIDVNSQSIYKKLEKGQLIISKKYTWDKTYEMKRNIIKEYLD